MRAERAAAGNDKVGQDMTTHGFHGSIAFLLLGLLAWPLQAAELEASVDWVRRVELGTPVSGVVTEVHADPGDRVAEGAPLVTLDPRPLAAALSSAEARQAKAEPARAEAERELERARELYERTLLSTHDLQLAEIGFAAADAELQAAQAAVQRARLDLEYSVVRAPFAGVVLARPAEPGQSVVSRLEARPLVVVAEARRRLAGSTATAEVIDGLQMGQEVTVQVDGDAVPGTVRHLGLEPVEPGVRPPRYALEVVFESPRPLRRGKEVVLILP